MQRCPASECWMDHFVADRASIASFCFRLSLCLAINVLTPCAQAQSTDEVHIVPRNQVDPATHPPMPEPASDPALNAHTRPLRADVDLVLIPATVTDGKNRPVTDLR